MKRAFLIELSVIGNYAVQLFGLGIFVAICTSLGTQTTAPIPGVLTCMYLIMGTMAASAYDDQNNWGLYRLTMPLSRRDVVLGRYAMIAVMGLLGTAAGFIGGIALSAVAGVVPLPGDLSSAFGLSAENVFATFMATSLCVIVGSIIAGIETPIYFRFGQTKATQWLPMITVLLFCGPIMLLGSGAQIDLSVVQAARDLLVFVTENLLGAIAFLAAGFIIAAIILFISAAVSLKLYNKREL